MNPVLITALTAGPVALAIVGIAWGKIRKRPAGPSATRASGPKWEEDKFYTNQTNCPPVSGPGFEPEIVVTPNPGLIRRDGAFCLTKNEALVAIAMRRNVIKDEIARLKRNKKRHSHFIPALQALTREELWLEGMK